jgi:hypothetical protein
MRTSRGFQRDAAAASDSRTTNVTSAFYTVTITNLTGDFWPELDIFYKVVNASGAADILAIEQSVPSGDTRVFTLGLCSEMASYLVTGFDGPDLLFRFPDQGVMTPTLASQVRPADQNPCADAWVFEPKVIEP